MIVVFRSYESVNAKDLLLATLAYAQGTRPSEHDMLHRSDPESVTPKHIVLYGIADTGYIASGSTFACFTDAYRYSITARIRRDIRTSS